MNNNMTPSPGYKYGTFTVKSLLIKSYRGKSWWKCICDCGYERNLSDKTLKNAASNKCDCIKAQTTSLMARKHSYTMPWAPKVQRKLYCAWIEIKRRCLNTKCIGYKNYGARGIKICDRWMHSFENFVEDMGHPSDLSLSLDRIDCLGNYEPANCRWATSVQQNSNRKNNIKIEYEGKPLNSVELAKKIGLTPSGVRKRIYNGWSLDKICSPSLINLVRQKRVPNPTL